MTFPILVFVLTTGLAGCPPGSGNGDFGPTPPSGIDANAPCTSGVWWQRGDRESERMHPGHNCIECHTSGGEEEGPTDGVYGTVMGGLNDTNDCQGISGAILRITDANGDVHESTTNEAGNFLLEVRNIPTPYTAEIELNGAVNAMATPQTDTNCMTCHTADGAGGAPGRILAP